MPRLYATPLFVFENSVSIRNGARLRNRLELLSTVSTENLDAHNDWVSDAIRKSPEIAGVAKRGP